MGTDQNGASLRRFFTEKLLKILAKFCIFNYEKYTKNNANVAWILSATPRSKTSLSYAIGNKKSNELPLFRLQWETFRHGDIFLGDKGFCSFFDIANLEKQGVDSVVTLARIKPINKSKCLKILGLNDLLIKWDRPQYNARLSYSREAREKLPKELVLRQIRAKEFYIVTTLLDKDLYPSKEIAELYLKRWDFELFFRDIKTTIGLDVLPMSLLREATTAISSFLRCCFEISPESPRFFFEPR